jgi:hypothetical protein
MFIIRAVFWITVVTILLPRDPDLTSRGQEKASASNAEETGLAVVDNFQGAALQSLERVKAELAAEKQRRHAEGKAGLTPI